MKGAEWSEVCGPQGCDSEGICLARKTEGRGAESKGFLRAHSFKLFGGALGRYALCGVQIPNAV